MLSSPLRAGLRNALSSRLRGQSDIALGTQAQSYFTALTAAGYSASFGQRLAVNTWINAGLNNGWYDKFDDFCLLGWGNASANAIKVKGGTSLSFTSTTHPAAGVVFGGTGFADYAKTAAACGMTTSSFGMSLYRRGTWSATTNTDCGCYDSGTGTNSTIMVLNYTAIGFLADYGNTTTARVTGTGLTSAALCTMNRLTTTTQKFTCIDSAGTQTTLSSAAISGGAASARNIYLGAANNNGTAVGYTAGTYSFFAARNGTAMNDTQRSAYEVDTMQLLNSLGWN